MKKIGIIGGSGFYEIGGTEKSGIDTPWGTSGDVLIKELEDRKLYFIPRHGQGHTVPPHLINYRANIYAFHKLGVKQILATNAVGSCRKELPPGSFVIPDNILDFTHGRKHTFFEGSSSTDIPASFQSVKHTDVTTPFDKGLRELIMAQMATMKIDYHDGGIIAVFNGPRYETAAEVNMVRNLGGHIMGMTSAPEAFLARELGIKYATTAVVTNFGAGMQESVSHDEVVELFDKNIETIKKIILSTANSI